MSLLSTPQNQIEQRVSGLTDPAPEGLGRVDRWCRAQVLKRLAQLQGGAIHLREEDQVVALGAGETAELRAELCVRNPRFFRRTVQGGSMGVAEAYMDGDWCADDLPALLQTFARDWSVSCELNRGWRQIKKPAERLWAWMRRNTLSGSRKNIAAHYDLSNQFYQLWLDETMAYSSAIFPSAESSLHEASENKFDIVCQKINLQPDDELLEIGTGWGGLAIYAAENYGCRVTTTTISREQHDFAARLIANRGLDRQITLLSSDYRALEGRYDKLVSIEMIEAVGHKYLPGYFAKCNQLLKPGGRMVLQAITIPDQRYERYKRSVDFIQRYVFPGGALPSLGAIQRAVGENTNLLLTGMQDYAQHYARTLAAWRERFFDRLHDVRRLGFDEQFIRTWDYYLSYCMAGFREQQIGLAHLEFVKK